MDLKLSRYNANKIVHYPSFSGVYKNGFDNLFSNYLNSLYANSPTFSSVIDDYVSYVFGDGLFADNPKEQAIINNFFDKDKVEEILLYYFLQSEVNIEVLRDEVFNAIDLKVFNPEVLRVSSIVDDEPEWFKYKRDWSPISPINYQRDVYIPKYSKTAERSLFRWYDSRTFNCFYGRPSYLSCRDAIEMEVNVYKMHNHGAANGMFPSMIYSQETSGDEEKDRKSAMLTQKMLSGPTNAGKSIPLFYQKGGSAPEFFTPNLTGLGDIYKDQYEKAEIGILKGLRVPSANLISGLNSKGSGFTSETEELVYAKAELKRKVINPARLKVLKILKPIFLDLGVYGGVSFIDEKGNNLQSEDTESNTNNSIKDMTGRQMQGLERISRKVGQGKITKEQGVMMLKSGFGFTTEQAELMLNSGSISLSAENNNVLDTLIELGEDIEEMEGWDLISSVPVSREEEEILGAEIRSLEDSVVNLVSTGRATPNTKSKQDGTKGDNQYKIRYRYAGDSTGQREFCSKMVKANKLYRIEDLINMSFQNANPGFGKGGSNNYNIFLYKGGPNCHHYWERVTFLKKGLEGSIDVRSPKATKLKESVADGLGLDPKNNKLSSIKPVDMPNKGYYKR